MKERRKEEQHGCVTEQGSAWPAVETSDGRLSPYL
jgi:hypothetical protein